MGPVRISAGILAEALRRSLASRCNRASSRRMSWRSEGISSSGKRHLQGEGPAAVPEHGRLQGASQGSGSMRRPVMHTAEEFGRQTGGTEGIEMAVMREAQPFRAIRDGRRCARRTRPAGSASGAAMYRSGRATPTSSQSNRHVRWPMSPPPRGWRSPAGRRRRPRRRASSAPDGSANTSAADRPSRASISARSTGRSSARMKGPEKNGSGVTGWRANKATHL